MYASTTYKLTIYFTQYAYSFKECAGAACLRLAYPLSQGEGMVVQRDRKCNACNGHILPSYTDPVYMWHHTSDT